MNVLLSIKPNYVDDILTGKKKFEFRKTIFKKKDISKVFIYSSSPVQKVVASFEIARIVEDSPLNLWDRFHKYGGIKKKDFFEYFKGSDIGYAIEISNLIELSEPIDPYSLVPDFKAPQSYCYLQLDYFDKKPHRNSSRKKYEIVYLAEENEEYATKESASNEINIYPNHSQSNLLNWQSITLSDIYLGKTKSISPNKNPNQTYELYSVPSFDIKTPEIIKGKEIGSSKQIVEENTVLLCKINPRINRVWIVGDNSQYPKIASTEWIPFQYISGILPKYLCYFMQNGAFREFLSRNVSGVGGSLMRIKVSTISNYPFLLPPLPEQRAIVSKIEQLFSELDNGIANLKLAQEQLKVYRQAVLKKAFEGELTKKWREQQSDLPDAAYLLEQIRVEREEAAKANGKKIKPLKPFTETEFVELAELSSGWKWVKIGEFTLGVEYGTSAKSKKTGKIPVLRMGNIQNGRFDWNDLVYTSDEAEIKKYLLKKNDVLFNRTNSPELVGKTAIYKGERPAIFAGYLIRINQLPALVVADYLNYFLNCHTAKVYGNSVKTDGVNQSNINGEKLRNYPFPICSLPEQQAIVQEIETRLSVCDKLEQDIAENLERAEALRQSILKKAFEGKLLNERGLEEVRNAPDWEPAGVLLERVRAERAKNGKM